MELAASRRDKPPVRYSYESPITTDNRALSSMAIGDISNTVSQKLPHMLREKQLKWNASDKIFTSHWLSESTVIVGTKCNKLYLVDPLCSHGELCCEELPTLSREQDSLVRPPSSGIHSMAVSPDGQFFATSGEHPNDLAIYQLPELTPLSLGQAHTDWLFDIQWVSESLLVTGSRDSTMALWSVTGQDSPQTLAEETPLIEPLFHFSNVRHTPSDAGERIRSLTYNTDTLELGSLQTNPCGAAVYFWDIYTFQQVSSTPLPFCAENVCLEVDSGGTGLYAAGSRSHVTLLDSRSPSSPTAIRSPDKDCGVRSLNFNSNQLSLGTGAGNLYFYDLRTNNFLLEDRVNYRKCALQSTPGWLRKDQTYLDFFSGLPRPPNAIYTHSYSPSRTKIFTAGGPLPLGLFGNYAAMWI